MENQLTEFQYFVDLFWIFFVGALFVRVLCGELGEAMSWIKIAFGGSDQN